MPKSTSFSRSAKYFLFLKQYILQLGTDLIGNIPLAALPTTTLSQFSSPQVLLRPMMVAIFLGFPGHLDDRSIGHELLVSST